MVSKFKVICSFQTVAPVKAESFLEAAQKVANDFPCFKQGCLKTQKGGLEVTKPTIVVLKNFKTKSKKEAEVFFYDEDGLCKPSDKKIKRLDLCY